MITLQEYLFLLELSDSEKELYNKVKDIKIKNPKTDRLVKVSTALSNKTHPAHSIALSYLKSDKKDNVDDIDLKINKLKQDYQKAQDDMDFDKVNSIVKQIQDLNKEKQSKSKPENNNTEIDSKIELLKQEYQKALQGDNVSKITDIANKIKDLVKQKQSGKYNKSEPLIDKNKIENNIKTIDKKIDLLNKEWAKAKKNRDWDTIDYTAEQIRKLNSDKQELINKLPKPEKRFKNKDEIKKYISTKYKHIPDPLLKKEEQKSAGFYRTDEGYFNINNYLRSGRETSDENKQHIKTLTNAIKKSKLEEDTELYRGIKLNKSLTEQLNKLKIGDTFSDKGFSSTSLDEEFTKKAFGGNLENTALFQINAKKGQSALPMENISTGDPDEDEQFEGEVEMLLSPNSKFKLISKEGNKYIFDLIN